MCKLITISGIILCPVIISEDKDNDDSDNLVRGDLLDVLRALKV
jgi:hypothetical protein